MHAVLITKVDFDRMENSYSDAICRDQLGVVVAETEVLARAMAEEYVRTFERPASYEGWDGETYPQFKFEILPVLK